MGREWREGVGREVFLRSKEDDIYLKFVNLKKFGIFLDRQTDRPTGRHCVS